MAIQEQTQSITAFMGLQEGLGDLALAAVFSSADSKNVWMDEFSRVARIGGYEKQNSSAVTANTSGDATKLVGLASYRKVSGGSVSRNVIGIFEDGDNEWEIHTSSNTGSTWTFREDLGSTAVGKVADFAQFGDILYITSGGAFTPREWNGTALSTSGSTQSPTITVSSGAAGNLNGDYEYRLVSKKVDGSRFATASAVSANVQLENEKGTLSWTSETDSSVIGYDLYRTTGTGKAFYFHSFIDGRTTNSFSDDKPDPELLAGAPLEVHGDAPPSCYLVEPHKQRMWWGRTDANPRRVYFSDIRLPDSNWQELNFLAFDDDKSVGDFITALVGGFEGALVVFLERSIWTITGSGEFGNEFYDWNVRRTSASIGAVSHRAVARVQAGSRYSNEVGQVVETSSTSIAYFTPHGDIRLFGGSATDVVISGPVKDLVASMNYAERDQVFVVDDPTRSHLTWFFPSGTTTYPDDAVTWNYRYGTWYNTPTPATFASGITVETSSESSLILLGEGQTKNGGFAYQWWSSNGFNAQPFTAEWVSKPLVGATDGDPSGASIAHRAKRYNWVSIIRNSSSNVSVDWFEGFPAIVSAIKKGTVTFPTTSGGTITTSDGNAITTTSGDTINALNQLIASGRKYMVESDGNYTVARAARFRIYDTSQEKPWVVEQLTYAYQLLPENIDSYSN